MNDVIRSNPSYIPVLERLVEYEENNPTPDSPHIEGTDYDSCWDYKDVGVKPHALYQMETEGLLERVFDSNNSTIYSIRDREGVKAAVEELDIEEGKEVVNHEFPDEDDLPEDLFDDVIGYPKVKWLFRRAITKDSITNFLMAGPPGSAKTVFLLCLRELDGSVFMSGARSSSPGYTELIFDKKPKYLLIDELDDMGASDQDGLSDFTDMGIISETKHNKTRQMEINTKTFATANNLDNIHDNIKQRFIDLHFEPYTKEEFKNVCAHLLPRREGTPEDEAIEIAQAVWSMENYGNVRKALSVAKLSDGDPHRVISVLDDYSKK